MRILILLIALALAGCANYNVYFNRVDRQPGAQYEPTESK